jgi:hypothetical protein
MEGFSQKVFTRLLLALPLLWIGSLLSWGELPVFVTGFHWETDEQMGQLPKSFFIRFQANSSLGAWANPSTDRSWFEKTFLIPLHEATRRVSVSCVTTRVLAYA